jgi:hypothetical protein
MARLAFPPTFYRFAASASTSAKPAARRKVSQRAPIQSAASRTKSISPRSSLIHPTVSRTTLGAVSTAIQPTRLAHNVSAVASRTDSSACVRALSEKISAREDTTDVEQKSLHLLTRIPGPKRTNEAHAKIRQFVPRLYRTVGKNKDDKRGRDEPTAAGAFDGFEAESEAGDTSIEIDNNPGLLNDVSFDETLDRYQQSSSQSQLAKFVLLGQTLRRGGQVYDCPAYSGDLFILPRKRPRGPSEQPMKQKIDIRSKIPCKATTTLRYGGELAEMRRAPKD